MTMNLCHGKESTSATPSLIHVTKQKRTIHVL